MQAGRDTDYLERLAVSTLLLVD